MTAERIVEALKKHPAAPSVAEHYHRQTIYAPDTLGSLTPDLDARPPLFRDYLSELALDLDSIATEEPEFDLVGRLSRLLFHTSGITLIHETTDGPVFFRAAPSAGALYPTETYLATRDIEEIPDGIHAYDPRYHQLVPLWEGDFGMDIEELCVRHAGAIRARMFLIFTAVFQKGFWRYRERAYRRILLDTGHLLGNAVAYAPKEGFQIVTVSGFFDAGLNDLLFLDQRDEAVLVVAPIIDLENVKDIRINSPFPFPSGKSVHSDSNLYDDGLMHVLHRRSRIKPDEKLLSRVPSKPLTLTRRAPKEDTETIFLVPPSDGGVQAGHVADLGNVIRERRSTRSFRRATVPFAALAGTLRYAYEPVVRYLRSRTGLALSNCVMADPTLLTTYVVVVNVEGMEPGVYLYDPEQASLHLEREGNFREEMHSICLHQNLGRDCSVAVIHMANLPVAVRRYGDRAYRYIHLDAGHIGQRLNLAALGSGVGVSGIGGFFDDEINELLGLPTAESTGMSRDIAAYVTLLGMV